jgi:A/G-specific adenine glycosylase
MLQQTPVVRVLPAWERWCARWPTPAALSADPPGEAVLAWERLGYPRRALRLHAAARAIVERHDGVVPSDLVELRALPGVGTYTAAAVASFAFRQRHPVLDTNVRRVLARATAGIADAPAGPTRAETAVAEALLPDEPETAAQWAVALMELGALVCTARLPACDRCPLVTTCAWHAAGAPAGSVRRRAQAWVGTDRQARGALLAAARAAAPGPVSSEVLDATWPGDRAQSERALHGLVADGLLASAGPGTWGLPGVGPLPQVAAEGTAVAWITAQEEPA